MTNVKDTISLEAEIRVLKHRLELSDEKQIQVMSSGYNAMKKLAVEQGIEIKQLQEEREEVAQELRKFKIAGDKIARDYNQLKEKLKSKDWYDEASYQLNRVFEKNEQINNLKQKLEKETIWHDEAEYKIIQLKEILKENKA